MAFCVFTVVFFNGKTKIQGGKHGENISLQRCYKQFKYSQRKSEHKAQRAAYPVIKHKYQTYDAHQYHVTGHDIGIETYHERKGFDEHAKQFDGR